MPAPKNPSTTAAIAATRRRGQETMARKLREAGWRVATPEEATGREEIRGLIEEAITEWLNERPAVDMDLEYNVRELADALSWKIKGEDVSPLP